MTLAEKIIAAHADATEVHSGQLLCVRADLVLADERFRAAAAEMVDEPALNGPPDSGNAVFVHHGRSRQTDCLQRLTQERFAARACTSRSVVVDSPGIEEIAARALNGRLENAMLLASEPSICRLGALGAFATTVGVTDVPFLMAAGRTWLRVPPTVKLVYHSKPMPGVSADDFALYTMGDLGVDGALYSVIEFAGPAIESLDIHGRFAMAGIATDVGAEAGLLRADDTTKKYLGRSALPVSGQVESDDASCSKVIEYNVGRIPPQVAVLSSPPEVVAVDEAEGRRIDTVFITDRDGRQLSHLRIAASLLASRHVHSELRLIVLIDSAAVYEEAVKEGLVDALTASGATIHRPNSRRTEEEIDSRGTCMVSGPATTCLTRDIVPPSEVLLAGPAVAAASAILGRVAGPAEVGA